MRMLVNIDVDDLDKAVRFYSEGLGFSPVRRLFQGRVAEMTGGGCLLHLLHKPTGAARAGETAIRRDYARHWTPVHLDIVVDDIVSARRTAVAAGATAEGEIRDTVWGQLACMADPFGHGFCLLAFNARGYAAGE